MLSRSKALEALSADPFDVVVIGGGITGAGVALDAASRGYSVALVERDDYAVGTSSRSSKMVHGGLRYLQNFDLGLVREALLERQLMVQLAPHLVYPTPFLVPTLGDARRSRALGIGLNMYDVMATTRVGQGRRERQARERSRQREGAEIVPEEEWAPDRHRTIPGEEAAELVPALAARDPKEAYLFYDCQTDDVRLVLTVLGEAERFGAVSLNGADGGEVISKTDPAAGVVCVDASSGERFEGRADTVVNATGVWADRIRPEEILTEEEVPRIAPSRGTHVTISQDLLPVGRAACIVPAGEERTIFALPWYGRALVGTTDRDYEGDIARVQPSGDDIEYLLDAANSFFGTDIGPGDLTGAYAGVRPLISTGDPRKSVDISRKAELYETSSGMVTITGGKLTTWRRMAKMTVDRIVERDGRDAPCRTHQVPLGMAVEPGDLPRVPGVPEDAYDQLAHRYGYAAHEVLRIAAERPELAAPVHPGMPDLLAEAAFAARREQARTVGDVLLRRTRLALTAAREVCAPGAAAPRLVADVLASELGGEPGRPAREVDAFRVEAAAEGVVVGAAG